MNKELERYLSEIAAQLNVDPAKEREILDELRSHLEEAIAEMPEEGLGDTGEGQRGPSGVR